jgi:arginase
VAVKIVRQPNRIAVLGAPVSAAALAPGTEGAPAAFRKAGLLSSLESLGLNVADLGDDPVQPFDTDDESPRARNIRRIIPALEALRPRVEIAAKSGALPLILGGGCSIALATVAGLRRYFRHVSVLYADADADLQTPATTRSGCVDGMVVSHLVGRGASELVRFWSEPPLVREPDLALFGTVRLDPAEEQTLQTSPLRRYFADDIRRKGAARAATEAIERIHGDSHEFVLHIDVDVFPDFQPVNLPSTGGLSREQIREACEVFIVQKHLAAIEITGYNPEKDADASGVKFLIDFLCGLLSVRTEKWKIEERKTAESKAAAAAAQPPASAEPAPAKAPQEKETDETVQTAGEIPPAAAPGESWSSDSLNMPGEPRHESESVEGPAGAHARDPEEPQS